MFNLIVKETSETNMSNLNLALAILGCIALCIGIIALIYAIIFFRKAGIVSKKLDYLVEDLTYKSELATPAIDAIVKIASYADLIESFLSKSSESMTKYISENKESTYKFVKKLKEIVQEK